MSLLDHLDELRGRLIKALLGIAAAYVASLFFAERIWLSISTPRGGDTGAVRL
jgi:Sec-independent protein secretion pathway component TatC